MRPAGTAAHALSPQRAAAQRGAVLSALCSGRFDDAPRRWVDIVVDTGLEIAKEIKPEEADEKQLEQVVRRRLILRLPQAKEG